MAITFATAMQEVASFYYRNGKIATIPAAGGTITPITSAFDEDPRLVAWNQERDLPRREPEGGGRPLQGRARLEGGGARASREPDRQRALATLSYHPLCRGTRRSEPVALAA